MGIFGHLTLAPLPEWRDVLAAWRVPLSDQALAAPWRRSGEQAFWLSRSAWSLAVIAESRRRWSNRPRVIVCVPDFFCNASLAPLRATGGRLVFYPVTVSLAPDKSWSDSWPGEPPDLFVLVHYFDNRGDRCGGGICASLAGGGRSACTASIVSVGQAGDFVCQPAQTPRDPRWWS